MNSIRPRLITLILELDRYIVVQQSKIAAGAYDPSLTAYYQAELGELTTARTSIQNALLATLPSPN
jgi:hypothetical protein